MLLSMLCRWLVSTSYRVLSYKDPVPSKSKPKLSTLHHVVRSVALLNHDAALLDKANDAVIRCMERLPSKSKPEPSTAYHVVHRSIMQQNGQGKCGASPCIFEGGSPEGLSHTRCAAACGCACRSAQLCCPVLLHPVLTPPAGCAPAAWPHLRQ